MDIVDDGNGYGGSYTQSDVVISCLTDGLEDILNSPYFLGVFDYGT